MESLLRTLNFLASRSDDDFIDRAHYYLTSNLCLASAILISWKQFGGHPIECMIPKMFPHTWEEYAENYCWAQDTYFLSFDVDVTRQTPRDYKISYYQWVPFFLLIEAACFRLPSLVWKYLAAHSGIRIHDIVRLAVDERNIQTDVKQTNIKALTVHLQNALRFHRRLLRKNVTPHRYIRFLNLPYSAIFVTFTYLLTKVLYLINVWTQLILLNKFLHTDRYSWYGWGVLTDLLSGTTWKTSGIFPRVTLCDFEVRGMGNLQNHTVQCVLVINIFNEKIFVFLWFWFMVLTLLTTASLLYWCYVMIFPWPSRWFISRHLELSEMPFDPKGSSKDVERFVISYLKTDGVFVLRMITMHAGIIFGTELVLSLWRSFYGIEERVKRGDSDPAYLTPTPTALGDDDKILNALRLRSKVKDKELLQRKAKTEDNIISKVSRQKDDPYFEEDYKKSYVHPPPSDESGFNEVLLKGPKTAKRASIKVKPTAPRRSLDTPDRQALVSVDAGKRGGEFKIDIDPIDDEDEESEADDSEAMIQQARLQAAELHESLPPNTNVKQTARNLDKYFNAR